MWFERVWQDVRHGLRLFARSPGFTAIAVISMALGTGANVAMFSATDTLLLRPPPIGRPDGLYTVGYALKLGPLSGTSTSHAEFVDIRRRSSAFQSWLAYVTDKAAVGVGTDAAQVRLVTAVTGNFFSELGIPMHLGRGFRADEDRVRGRDAVAVISYGMWKQLLHGDPGAIGRQVVIANRRYTVVGVIAESFSGMLARSVRESAYVPMAMWGEVLPLPGRDPFTERDLRDLVVKARLRDGTGIDEARQELAIISGELARAYPKTNEGRTLLALTELQARVSSNSLEAGLLLILNILAIAVLGVACANVAGLLTSRGPLRQRELSLRMAIGAGRGRLVGQLLAESLAIAVAGGLGGIAVGYAGISLISRIEFPTDFIAPPVFALDGRALTFAIVVAVASVILFGLGPALTTTRIDLSQSFRGTGPAGLRRWRPTGRSTLIALQVALSLVLLTAATMTYQTFARTFGQGPGFRTTGIAKVSVEAAQAGYQGREAVELFQRLAAQTRALPGVTSASVASVVPLLGIDLVEMFLDRAGAADGHEHLSAFGNVVDEGYFETMEIPLLRGRTFSPADTARSPRVAVVNDTMAARLWPGEDPLGRHFRIRQERGETVEIVGVVGNSMYLYPGEPPQGMVFLPFRQEPRGNMTLLAQTDGPSAGPLPAMRGLVRRADARVAVYDVQTIETFYRATATGLGEVIMAMIGAIGLTGVTITLVGLHGLVSYAVNRRTREIGIRIAIGATYGRVLGMLLRQGLSPAWAGLAIGLVLSLFTGRLLLAAVPSSAVYDPLAIVALVPVLLVVTLLAAFVPARRAATINPIVALREE